ncbi:hypothetical protein EI77_02180 [Prosthecobacter fusiformis]|uniref:Uncharacterized protein n=1 Tax=Prosthecobacter fusiformis TaxID=48464 RepID=A0A4R7RYT5_9BACT|nr:hypothetical protein [Prosthecobacter fusiformis]TDU71062.1 hypothetical protein EI77_02180 [Prosthecobacter fusiformis]
MRPATRRQILTCLALLALGWAQVFGIMRGYVCDCGGEVEITAYDHCHGPHGIACHHDDSPAHHQHDENGEDTHEHAPLKEPVQAKQLVSQSVSVPLPVLAVMPPWEPLTVLLASMDAVGRPVPPPRNDRIGQRWPEVLTRTIALRV